MSRLRPQPTTITSAGFKLLAVSVLAGPAGFAFAMPELLIIAVLPPVLMLVVWLWWMVRRPKLQLQRAVPTRASVGETIEGRLEVRSTRRHSGVVQVVGGMGDNGAEPIFVGPVTRSAPAVLRIMATPRQRGPMGWGASELWQVDPVGLLTKRRAVDAHAVTTVRPRVHRLYLPEEALGVGAIAEASLWQAPTQLQEELAGLRNYQAGDDLRHVHWAAVARTGSLVVRQFEHGEDHRLLLRFDDRAVAHDAASFERAVEAVASFSVAAMRAGMDTVVETWSNPERFYVHDGDSLDELLDRLAVVHVVHGDDQPSVDPKSRWTNSGSDLERTGLVLVCGTHRSAAATIIGAGDHPAMLIALVACDSTPVPQSATSSSPAPSSSLATYSSPAPAMFDGPSVPTGPSRDNGLVTLPFPDSQTFLRSWNELIAGLQ